MKAVQFGEYGGPDQLQIVELPDPQPGAGDLLVEVAAASINPIDWKMREGLLTGTFELSLPHTPGRDFAGIVRGLGDGVTGVEEGETVFGVGVPTRPGSHAELIAVPADAVAPKPPAMSYEEGAALGVSGLTVLAALEETLQIGDGQRVLIHAGAGGVGHLAIQYASHKGAEVITTASPDHHDFVHQMGADVAIDYNASDFVAASPDCDIVFDTIGGEVYRKSLDALKPGGTLVFINAGPIPEDAKRDDVKVVQAMVKGGSKAVQRMADLWEDEVLEPVVTDKFALENFAEAYAIVETGHARGKTVLIT